MIKYSFFLLWMGFTQLQAEEADRQGGKVRNRPDTAPAYAVNHANGLSVWQSSQQGVTVTGTVSDASGEPLPGDNVMIKGSLA
ncbi:MAG: carboxypeptidase-like regulatory domain-containing protein, partial [Tannerella sp.]|nr:carboxypeptidase-like regulatory domain-containing protein [Tannerella sp.]